MHDDDMSGELRADTRMCECECMCEKGLPRVTVTVTLVLGVVLATVLTGGWGALYGW